MLAPADLDVALRFAGDDNPDPVPWDRVQWLARAPLFERALAEAKRADDPVWRAGGPIAVARGLGRRPTPYPRGPYPGGGRVPAGPRVREFYSPWLALNVGRIWVGIGRLDRALSRLSNGNAETITALLEMARAHPEAAARLRRHGLALARKADSGAGQIVGWSDTAGNVAERAALPQVPG